MTARIPDTVLRETVEVCKATAEPKCPEPGCGVGIDRPKCMFELGGDCPRHGLRNEWIDRKREFIKRAADPSHGMVAMAEEILWIRREVAAIREVLDDVPHDEDCAYILTLMRRDGTGKRIPVSPCNCIKSRIGEATGKDSLQVQGEAKA